MAGEPSGSPFTGFLAAGLQPRDHVGASWLKPNREKAGEPACGDHARPRLPAVNGGPKTATREGPFTGLKQATFTPGLV